MIKVNDGVDVEHLDPDFRDKQLYPLLNSMPFDNLIVSAFRTTEHQRQLHKARQAWVKYVSGGGPKVPRANPANRPGTSAHEGYPPDNLGHAADVHPIPETGENWRKLHNSCRAFGIEMNKAREPWHAQPEGWQVPARG